MRNVFDFRKTSNKGIIFACVIIAIIFSSSLIIVGFSTRTQIFVDKREGKYNYYLFNEIGGSANQIYVNISGILYPDRQYVVSVHLAFYDENDEVVRNKTLSKLGLYFLSGKWSSMSTNVESKYIMHELSFYASKISINSLFWMEVIMYSTILIFASINIYRWYFDDFYFRYKVRLVKKVTETEAIDLVEKRQQEREQRRKRRIRKKSEIKSKK